MEARIELVELLVKVRRVQEESIVPHVEPGTTLANPTLPDHRDQIAAPHGIDEDGPLLERDALCLAGAGGLARHAECSFHHANASGMPTSGRTVGAQPSSFRARSDENGLLRLKV